MKNTLLNSRAVFCMALFCILFGFTAHAVNISFSFKLSVGGRTSAGVFAKDGTLLRTLWSGVRYDAGRHTAVWDGTDDEGKLLDAGTYTVRVLVNNVTYRWEGVVGNTSDLMSGPTVLRGYQTIYDMAFSGTKAYYASGYQEQHPVIDEISIKNPQSKTALLTPGVTTRYVATDGNYVYWDGQDPNKTSSTFVYATKAADGSEVAFACGTVLRTVYVRTYKAAIDLGVGAHAKITGLAVQNNGAYLFTAHGGENELHVLNKTTGALVQTIPMAAPAALATDPDGNVWVTAGTTVLKYTVNTNGTLFKTAVALAGLAQPLGVAVSPDGATIIVADGGASQQIKAFSTVDGASLWTYGQPGGYATDPTVANDKFCFYDLDVKHTFLAFAPDGSFWVGDPGNGRVQHFAANRGYIERMMYLPHFYSMAADPNNPSHVFADYLEFQVDYSKKLGPHNGSWALVKNWTAGVQAGYDNKYFRLMCVTTLPNGRVYALLPHENKNAVVELPAKGNIRYTGVELANVNERIDPDGCLRGPSDRNIGSPTVWALQKLTGFDSLNNPVWAATVTFASTPPINKTDPVFSGNRVNLHSQQITSTNILVSFDGGEPPNGSAGYHLGGLDLNHNTGKWLWKTARSTIKGYSGPFPANGDYDIGNGVGYSGNAAMASGRNIFWGYHGEFWKGSEVNKWNQVYDDGLLVGQFGATGVDTDEEAAPMMAGNSFAASLVTGSDGNLYLYHNDESYHSGIHRWKITGLNTITEQSIPVSLPSPTGGLLGQYYNGAGINNLAMITERIDTAVNFLSNPLGPGFASASNFSVRWTGFVKPAHAETYTFYASAKSGVRLWVNHILLINQWQNGPTTAYSHTIYLAAATSYPIRVEYINTGATGIKLFWSCAGLPKTTIPSSCLYPANPPDTSKGFDLMEGLAFDTALQNNEYGWSRSPAAENNTNYYSQWWNVKTNARVYNAMASPDVYAHFTQAAGNAAVDRDLGTNALLAAWHITGIIDYFGNAENNTGDGGGAYLEVLDAAGKIIARFYTGQVHTTDYFLTVYGNTAIIASGTKANMQRAVLWRPQPLCVTATKGVVTFAYGPYPPITAAVFDKASDWRSPKTLRLYFFGGGRNYGRIIDLQMMRFVRNRF